MPKLKLKAGGYYKDRSGNIIGPLKETEYGDFVSPDKATYYANGAFMKDAVMNADLVEEYIPPPKSASYLVEWLSPEEANERQSFNVDMVPQLIALDDLESIQAMRDKNIRLIEVRLIYDGSDEWKLLQRRDFIPS